MNKRLRIGVTGVVQGVGFRPFVYGLASHLGLGGHVRNEPRGVEIELEGPKDSIDAFLDQLRTSPPSLAHIQSIESEELHPTGEATFHIEHSEGDGQRLVQVPADTATCVDCLREMRSPADRRYRYPFINCTNCGPRYTIISDVPYDRERTTMAPFMMCPACRAEYEDPANRRFHAEPTCCPECGPRVELVDRNGIGLTKKNPVEAAVRMLESGAIVAVKGLGGYHLACDASNVDAVHLLRRRKHRDLKPFAVMVRDLPGVERLCEVTELQAGILSGRERPILLLRKRTECVLAGEVAPRNPNLGVMLPYTPLHELLFEGMFPALVMTSGNISDEPIAHKDGDAFSRLRELADAYLVHNREIHIRTDDSVVRVAAGQPRFLRRSRGYAPFPVQLPFTPSGGSVLATGAELSATICMTRGDQAFLSHHLGDLENLATYESFLQAVDHLQALLAVSLETVACDLHPDYATTRYARKCGLPMLQVQHHHAHVAAVMAENARTDKVIGVAFDGIGWGDDGTAWGGEFLECDLAGYRRAAHLRVVPQPSGDAAAKRPARMAYVYLREAFGEQADSLAAQLLCDMTENERDVLARMIARGLNCPRTSSMGRLFDAASALLGICSVNTYHAQAPVELEAQAWLAGPENAHYPATIDKTAAGETIINGADIILEMVVDFLRGTPAPVCAARFHNSIAAVTVETCKRIREQSTLKTVALSGGVFANAFLLERTVRLLEAEDFEVLCNAKVPAGDGGISLGQAAIAAWARRQ